MQSRGQLADINQIYADDPNLQDDELRSLQIEAQNNVTTLEAQVKGLAQDASQVYAKSQTYAAPVEKSVQTSFAASYAQPAPSAQPAQIPAMSSAGQSSQSAAAPEIPKRMIFRVKENVTAKYHVDKEYYPATIVAMMGSLIDPVYTVKFTGYEGSETVHARDIRPVLIVSNASGVKRSADTVKLPIAAAPNPAHIISAAPVIDHAKVDAIKNPPNAKRADANPPSTNARPEKRMKKNARRLEEAKNNWKDFQAQTNKGKGARQSIFRTADGPNGRGMSAYR